MPCRACRRSSSPTERNSPCPPSPNPLLPALYPSTTRCYRPPSSAVEGAFTMCGITARCVGVSTVPVREQGNVTGLIGVHGKVSGFFTVNMAERVAVRAVGGLLQEEFKELNSQVVDGAGEIANLVVGGIKSALASSKWGFTQITVPSVIVGTWLLDRLRPRPRVLERHIRARRQRSRAPRRPADPSQHVATDAVGVPVCGRRLRRRSALLRQKQTGHRRVEQSSRKAHE